MKDDPFLRPIRPISEEDRDRLRTSGIEPIHDAFEEHEREQELLAFQRRVSPIASFLLFFKQLLGKMKPSYTAQAEILKDDGLYKELYTLKTLLQQLAERDQSENVEYAEALSQAWITIGYHCESIEAGIMKSSISSKGIRELLSSMSSHPEHSEHTLGFYLKHHAGNDWLPFPFMEILKKIHRSYAVDGNASALHGWITKVSALLPGKDINENFTT